MTPLERARAAVPSAPTEVSDWWIETNAVGQEGQLMAVHVWERGDGVLCFSDPDEDGDTVEVDTVDAVLRWSHPIDPVTKSRDWKADRDRLAAEVERLRAGIGEAVLMIGEPIAYEPWYPNEIQAVDLLRSLLTPTPEAPDDR